MIRYCSMDCKLCLSCAWPWEFLQVRCEDLQKKSTREGRSKDLFSGRLPSWSLPSNRQSCLPRAYRGQQLEQRGAAGLAALCCSRRDASWQLPQVISLHFLLWCIWVPGAQSGAFLHVQLCPCTAPCVFKGSTSPACCETPSLRALLAQVRSGPNI